MTTEFLIIVFFSVVYEGVRVCVNMYRHTHMLVLVKAIGRY